MIDSVGDKGTALSSQQAKGKLNRLNEEYRTLCTAAEVSIVKVVIGKKGRLISKPKENLTDLMKNTEHLCTAAEYLCTVHSIVKIVIEKKGGRGGLISKLKDKFIDLMKNTEHCVLQHR